MYLMGLVRANRWPAWLFVLFCLGPTLALRRWYQDFAFSLFYYKKYQRVRLNGSMCFLSKVSFVIYNSVSIEACIPIYS